MASKYGIMFKKNYYLNVRRNKDNSLSDNSDSYIKKDEDIKTHLLKRGFEVISVIDPSEYIKSNSQKQL